jgi:hypothetical protein
LFEVTKAVAANNRTHKKEKQTMKYQWGGTSLVAFGKITYHMDKQGVYETGMGRWCLMKIIVEDNKANIVILAYATHTPIGPASVDSQHRRNFNSIRWDVDPADAFWTDLARCIHKWKYAGDSIILQVDFNIDVR